MTAVSAELQHVVVVVVVVVALRVVIIPVLLVYARHVQVALVKTFDQSGLFVQTKSETTLSNSVRFKLPFLFASFSPSVTKQSPRVKEKEASTTTAKTAGTCKCTVMHATNERSSRPKILFGQVALKVLGR